MQSCEVFTTYAQQAEQFYLGFLPMAGSPRFELGITESKSVELPLLHEPLNSIAFHPFYGTPYIFPKLAWVATPTLILLYHRH